MKTMNLLLTIVAMACSGAALTGSIQEHRRADRLESAIAESRQQKPSQDLPVVTSPDSGRLFVAKVIDRRENAPVGVQSALSYRNSSNGLEKESRPVQPRRWQGMGQFDSSGRPVTVTEVDHPDCGRCSGGRCRVK